jgi:hypothetical protein
VDLQALLFGGIFQLYYASICFVYLQLSAACERSNRVGPIWNCCLPEWLPVGTHSPAIASKYGQRVSVTAWGPSIEHDCQPGHTWHAVCGQCQLPDHHGMQAKKAGSQAHHEMIGRYSYKIPHAGGTLQHGIHPKWLRQALQALGGQGHDMAVAIVGSKASPPHGGKVPVTNSYEQTRRCLLT